MIEWYNILKNQVLLFFLLKFLYLLFLSSMLSISVSLTCLLHYHLSHTVWQTKIDIIQGLFVDLRIITNTTRNWFLWLELSAAILLYCRCLWFSFPLGSKVRSRHYLRSFRASSSCNSAYLRWLLGYDIECLYHCLY
jgi:hypothetical protein